MRVIKTKFRMLFLELVGVTELGREWTRSVSQMPSFLREKSKASEVECEDLTVFDVYRYLLFSIFSICFKYSSFKN